MLSPSVISIILWVPFVVVFLISALIFCIAGYRKGLWRALISLGITIVSAIISFFLSKVVAGVVSGGIVASVLASLPADQVGVAIIKTLIPSLVQAILAVVFFAGIFFVVTLIGKIIGNVVKRDALQVEHPGLKWGGLGVRFVDAIVYTVLFLLPLYGTLGTFAPTVQTVLKLGGEEMAIFAEYLGAITNHPVVGMTNNSVIGDVYGGLMDASGTTNSDGSTNVNVNEVVDAMDQTMVKFEALQSATTDEEFEDACLDLVTHLKENVVEADWSYDMIQETTTVMKEEIVNSMQNASPEEIKQVETVVSMLDMTKEEFQENGVVMLEFVEYALKNDVMDSLESGDMSALQNEEFYEEAATLLNATEKTNEIKKYLITETVSTMVGGDAAAVEEIMSSYDDSAVTTPEAQKQEIQAWIEITTAETEEEAIAALKNIPTLDENVIDNILKNLGGN
jgi:hypothetical protein